MKIERIIITSDLLRPMWVDGKAQNKETIRINKYYDFLIWQLTTATELPVIKLSTQNSDWDFFALYKHLGVEFKNVNSWLEVYDTQTITSNAIEYFNSFFHDSFIICHEMPPIFKKLCDTLNIGYIDIRIHPVRFLDDHLFGMSTNTVEVFEKIKKYLVDDRSFYLYANLYKATADFYSLSLDKNSALIAGQTNVDAALYENGTVHTIYEYEDAIRELGEKYKTVYYKAHPFNNDLKGIYEFLNKFPFIKYTDENIYKLLSCDEIKGVYAISSGVLTEAEYFGKESYPFFRKFNKYSYDKNVSFSSNIYLTIQNDFYNPIFWRNIFDGTLPVKNECIDMPVPFRGNRMRAALNDYWGNTVFDPGVITATKEVNRIIENSSINKQIQDYEDEIKDLKKQVEYLNGKLFILTNDPVFERGFLKKNGKKLLFKLSEESLFWNAVAIDTKMRKMASLYQDRFIHVERIKCLTYRPKALRGGRGGAGAVLSAMNVLLGSKIGKYPAEYIYSEKDGIWHTLNNKFFNSWTYPNYINTKSNLTMLWAAVAFAFDKTKNDCNTLYICHDYATAYGLSLLNKKYILIIHTQGPRLEEKINLNEPISAIEKHFVKQCERRALESAIMVCFPSKGSIDMFFDSRFASVKKEKVAIGNVLYNTVYAEVKETPIQSLARDDNKITFLSIGTLTIAKGIDNVCDFMKEFLEIESRSVRWILVGKGVLKDKILTDMKKLECKYENFEFIYFEKCGFSQINYLQLISDCYIMLHRISVFDLATLEAMKNKCALILSHVGGNIEFDRDDNVIFYENDMKALARKIKQTDIEEYKQKNVDVYNSFFSHEQFKRRYLEQINEITERLDEI